MPCRCAPDPRLTSSAPNPSDYAIHAVDGELVPDKARTWVPRERRLFSRLDDKTIAVNRTLWLRASDAQRAALVAHEMGHHEMASAACEPCADRRAGAILARWGYSEQAACEAFRSLIASRPDCHLDVREGHRAVSGVPTRADDARRQSHAALPADALPALNPASLPGWSTLLAALDPVGGEPSPLPGPTEGLDLAVDVSAMAARMVGQTHAATADRDAACALRLRALMQPAPVGALWRLAMTRSRADVLMSVRDRVAGPAADVLRPLCQGGPVDGRALRAWSVLLASLAPHLDVARVRTEMARAVPVFAVLRGEYVKGGVVTAPPSTHTPAGRRAVLVRPVREALDAAARKAHAADAPPIPPVVIVTGG